MTETTTETDLGERLRLMEKANLQEWFDHQIATLPHLPMPNKVLRLTDLHAGDGGIGKHIDPLKCSGMESAILDLLDSHQDYTWVLDEVWDVWRSYFLKACENAHQKLCGRIEKQRQRIHRAVPMCYELISNHVMDELSFLLPAAIFEGFNKKFFFYHGHIGDWPNDEGWKIGRAMVRMADELGIDPHSSPHASSIDRHATVRSLMLDLAYNNTDWEIFTGHTHFYEERGYYNSGSPITGKLTYFEIIEGEIQGKGDV
jgi:hypothetical protein